MTSTPTAVATDQPISSRLAMRLAAAADGYQNGKTVWFTARLEPDEDGSFHMSPAIEAEDRPNLSLEPGVVLFGPYRSDRQGPEKTTPVVRVTLELSNGKTIGFPATRYDAIIWSTSSLGKFAIPHYVAFEGLEAAGVLRDKFVNDASVFVMAHGPNTEYDLHPVDGVAGGQLIEI
jgi:hypothetical protein